MKPFNVRLRLLRERAGLTQEQFAHACGKSGQAWTGNYEGGTREPKVSELPLIAKVLGVTIPELFSDTEKNSAPNRDLQPLPVRLDPAILILAFSAATAAVFADKGRELNLTKKRDAQILCDAYAVIAEHGGLPKGEVTSALNAVVPSQRKSGGVKPHGAAKAPHRTARKR